MTEERKAEIRRYAADPEEVSPACLGRALRECLAALEEAEYRDPVEAFNALREAVGGAMDHIDPV